MRTLDPGEIWDFLMAGTRTGKLATVRADGRPHVAPVWFVMDGDDAVFTTAEDTVKAANLACDPRASLCVDDDTFPYGFALVTGRCEVSAPPVDRLRVFTRRLAARYVPPERIDAFADRNAVPGELFVRLRPDHVVGQVELAH